MLAVEQRAVARRLLTAARAREVVGRVPTCVVEESERVHLEGIVVVVVVVEEKDAVRRDLR